MEAYKFETIVQENGIIQLPQISKFVNQEIEIFIVLKQTDKRSDNDKKLTIDQFANKWKGFLKGSNPDNSKFNYISEKYK